MKKEHWIMLGIVVGGVIIGGVLTNHLISPAIDHLIPTYKSKAPAAPVATAPAAAPAPATV
jgi:hypothetical protein